MTVGISLDGPEDLHDACRRTRDGRGTYSRAMGGLKLLQRFGVNHHVLTVLTHATLARARDLHAFYVSAGIESVAFNVEEIEHAHLTSSLQHSPPDLALAFFEQFQEEVAKHRSPRHVRELDRALAFILRTDPGVPTNELVKAFVTISVDCRGNFSTFSPELLGATSTLYGDLTLGNVHHESFDDSRVLARLKLLSEAISAGVANCEATCEFFSGCGGGQPSNKLFEHGNLRATETMSCRLQIKAPATAALIAVERLLHRPTAGRPG